MGKWAFRFSCGNPKLAAIVYGSFAIIQFSVESLFLLCFAVYAATPISTVTKVFYALAAIFCPFLLVLSALFVFSLSHDEHRWMSLWIFAYLIVTIAELAFTVIAFALVGDFHEIFTFFSNSWTLAQYQVNNQLLMGNATNCLPADNSLLPSSGDGVLLAALISQQGASGLIAFIVIGLIFKNGLNILMLIVGIAAYKEVRDEPATTRRTSSLYDPYTRDAVSRTRSRANTRIRTVAR